MGLGVWVDWRLLHKQNAGQLKVWEASSNGYQCVQTVEGNTCFDVFSLGNANMYTLMGSKKNVRLLSSIVSRLNINSTAMQNEWQQVPLR